MKNFFRWLMLAVLCCSLLLPTVTTASPVGAITNAAGERIGMQDVPDRGDYPEKIHRRYCSENPTFPAIKASVMTPNSIKDARRMPAGDVLDVRCKELRTVWKTLPVFASDSSAQLKTVSAQLRDLNTKLDGFGKELTSLKVAVADLPPAVQRSLVPPERALFWKTHTFWQYVLFALVIALLAANLYGQPYYREVITGRRIYADEGPVAPGFRSTARNTYREPRERQSNPYRTAWVEHPENDPNSLQIFVAVETDERRLRLFRYETTKIVGSNAYPGLLRPGEARDELVLANDVLGAVERYCGTITTVSAEERRWLDAALHDGRLREITSFLSR